MTIIPTYKKYNDISFSGLNRQLAQCKFKDRNNIKTLNTLYQKSNGIVGNLPSQWIKNMPKNERAYLIPALYKELGNFFKPHTLYEELGAVLKKQALYDRVNDLTTILKKYKAIKNNAKIEFRYINDGAYGRGYRFENKSDNTDFFIKRFREESPYDTKGHGTLAECNTKIFLKHKAKTKKEKSSLSKFYYGDINNGYYIEDFISCAGEYDKSISDKERTVLVGNFQKFLEKFGLYHNDCNEGNYKVIKTDNGDYIQVFDLGGVY